MRRNVPHAPRPRAFPDDLNPVDCMYVVAYPLLDHWAAEAALRPLSQPASRRAMPILVHARELWSDTGIDLVEGVTYDLQGEGEWIDWRIRCGPDGFASRNLLLRLAERWRRAPERPWFELTGCIGRDESTRFPIGCGTRFTATASGRLFCFANDCRIAYGNNKGAVELKVAQAA